MFPVLASTSLLLALSPAVVRGQDDNPFGPDPPSGGAAPSGSLPANLVPAQFNVKQDALGFSWMFDGQGMVQGINNCAFQAGAVLRVDDNNVDFTSSGQAMMTPDGNEFVFVGTVDSNLRVTRRAKLDAATGSVRFLDTFQNTGAAPQQVNIQVTSNLRTNAAAAVLGPSGTPLGASTARFRRLQIQATLGPKDCGVVAVPQAGFPMPAAIFYLGGREQPPETVACQQYRPRFPFTFATSLPPQKDVHDHLWIVQRNAPPLDAKSLAALFKAFQSRAWTADLPPAVRKSIANLGRTYSVEEVPAGSHVATAAGCRRPLFSRAGAKRTCGCQDEQSQLAGKLQGGEITVEGRFGKTTVPLDEVALIVGGAGGEDPRGSTSATARSWSANSRGRKCGSRRPAGWKRSCCRRRSITCSCTPSAATARCRPGRPVERPAERAAERPAAWPLSRPSTANG